MDLLERLILWILLTVVGQVTSGRVILSGPSIQTSDLRAIDGYVASGLPLFSNTHGFVLHSGMRPVIVKVKDPNKVIRDGIEQPNAGYYRDLPSVIPQGFEGVASTSFLLGHPIPPPKFFAPSAGPVVSFQAPIYRQPIAMAMKAEVNSASEFLQQQQQQQQQHQQQLQQQYESSEGQNGQQQIAEPSIRVENTLNLENRGLNQIGENDYKQNRNPVVVQTSEFESNLPSDYRNPFYRNEMLASTLAQESLPAPGEEVVNEWNTNKIREGRVRDLLRDAGLI